MSLYNCKKDELAYRITKFDEDFDVESSYLTTHKACDCPAGVRDTCRHRQMLPEFVAAKRIDTGWLLDWDDREWYYFDPETGTLMDKEPKKKSWRRI
jgi:hypothetical protein